MDMNAKLEFFTHIKQSQPVNYQQGNYFHPHDIQQEMKPPNLKPVLQKTV